MKIRDEGEEKGKDVCFAHGWQSARCAPVRPHRGDLML